MNPFIAKDDGKYVLFSITFAVVPYVGTWIEICHVLLKLLVALGRSLRGNVDRNRLRGDFRRGELLSFPTWERG